MDDPIASADLRMEAIEQMFALGGWMHDRLDGLPIPTSDSTLIPVLSLALSLQHHQGIAFLLRDGVYGSAFALARPAAEAYVRGIWLRECGGATHIAQHKRDRLRTPFATMIEELEAKPGFDGGVLHRFHTESWSVLNSFAHGGPAQTSRQLSEYAIEPRVTVGEVKELSLFASAIALLAFQGVVLAAGREDLALQALEQMKHLGA